MRSRTFIRSSALFISLLCMGQIAHGMTEQIFTFREGQLNATWEAFGQIQGSRDADGMAIIAGKGGLLSAMVTLDEPLPQGAILVTSSDRPLSLQFVWNESLERDPGLVEMPIRVNAGQHVETPIVLSHYPEWKDIIRIGISFPEDTSLVIHDLRFYRFNMWERLTERVKSFYTFDEYLAYSINFVWGPQIANNIIQRTIMMNSLPPKAFSGTLMLYIFGALGLAAIAIFGWVRKMQIAKIMSFGIAFVLCLWIFLDIRMGSEFFSWVWHDHSTYIAAASEDRIFRERGDFYDFASFAAPLVADRKTYIFFAPREWPYLGNIRYITYPAIPGSKTDVDDTWVAFGRPDIVLNEQNQLTMEGQVISKPGTMIGEFREGSFVFRTLP